MDILKTLAEEFSIKEEQVKDTVALIDEGNTIPFISRYRKEVTGGLDDATLRDLNDRLSYLRKMDERRAEISSLIEAQEKLTPEITFALNNAKTLVELEDIYLPFRPKRKTRASVARDKGLEPLANYILEQRDSYEPTIEEYAEQFISAEEGKEVPDAKAALAGASDIIAEDVSNNAEIRKLLREFTMQNGSLTTKGTTEETSVYENYYDFSEPIKKLKGHRVLAINRGEKEEFLKVSVTLPEEDGVAQLVSKVITNKQSPALPFLMETLKDAYDRLLFPATEREIRTTLFDDACEGALKVFSENLRNLLLGAPLKGKTVLGYDPGYAHGCKLAVVDKTGKVLDTGVIYPVKPREDIERSKATVLRLIKKCGVDVIAIGNGTASRESEKFIAEHVLRDPSCPKTVKYTIVSEAGASVYSASKVATEEFPDYDVMQRSAISIARRIQDPLAELVKIEPKAIGVGQYQHDMKQARLTESLGGVVEDCVNSVGVDVNTASYSLLSYVSGINTTAAKNIVKFREENGEFKTRAQILKVPKIGEKAFTQCAGFLRIHDGKQVLDSTGVHPESYAIAEDLLKRFGFELSDVGGNLALLRFKATQYGIAKLARELGCGEPTLEDIISELEKPGRDIRDDAPAPVLSSDVLDINDLKIGMQLKGTVRNVVDFGCFVDIGVHHDGLLHISEMSDKYVKRPADLFKTGDVIEVKIKDVDTKKCRISLTRKGMNV
ncbi:MAG: RNA-binding transcriptional accessory protein [Clostridia bacterium]|nr:RNA-binding transcriptional accessory protein [Clostridia bacterium]